MELGLNMLVARYNETMDAVVYDVEDSTSKVTHRGDDTCNLAEIIRVYLDDYTSLDIARLQVCIYQKVCKELVALEVPDQKAIWRAERVEQARVNADPDYDELGKEERMKCVWACA